MRLKVITLSGMPISYYDIPKSVFFRCFRNFIFNSSKKNVITAGKYSVNLTNEFTILAPILRKDFGSFIPNFEQALSLARILIASDVPISEPKLLIIFLDSEIIFDFKQNKFYQVQIQCNNIIRFNAKQIDSPEYYSKYMHATDNCTLTDNNIE